MSKLFSALGREGERQRDVSSGPALAVRPMDTGERKGLTKPEGATIRSSASASDTPAHPGPLSTGIDND